MSFVCTVTPPLLTYQIFQIVRQPLQVSRDSGVYCPHLLGNPTTVTGINAQVARIYQLLGEFHLALTVHNPNDVDQRLENMLALWTDDGSLTFGPNMFSGKGEPGTESCDAGAGTLCDFWANVAPAFQAPMISLVPAYATQIDVHGNTASVVLECHLFNMDWDVTAKIAVDATVVKVGSEWLFTDALMTPLPPDSIPYP